MSGTLRQRFEPQRWRHTLVGTCSVCGGPQVAVWEDHERGNAMRRYQEELMDQMPNPCVRCFIREQTEKPA